MGYLAGSTPIHSDSPKISSKRYVGPMTRIGVQLPNFSGFDPGDLFDHISGLATTAEDSGFDSVYVMDHFFQLPPLGGPDQPMLEAYTLLGALAARTQRVQLGTLLTGVTYRNPGILSKIVTTLGHRVVGPSHPRNRRRVE